MIEALAGAGTDELVERRAAVAGVDAVQQATAFPDAAADRDLAEHDLENLLAADLHARVLVDDRGERSRRLVANVEARIVEPEHQAARRALGHADREHAREPPAYRKILVGIEQRVDELTDVLLGHLPQREHRVLGDRIPGEQRDDVRDECGFHAFVSREHVDDARAIARPQCEDVAHIRIERCGIDGAARRGGRRGRADRGAGAVRSREEQSSRLSVAHRRVGSIGAARALGQIDEAVRQRAEVAAIQTARREQRADRAQDRQRENRGGLRRRRQLDHQPDEAAADPIAQAIESDVDERFGRALFVGGNRRVEQLVSGAEERAAEDRLSAAREDQAAEARRDEAGEAAGEQRAGRRARGHRQPEALEDGARGRRLQRERQQTRRRVIQREKAQQIVAASEGVDRLRLEQIVDERRAGRPQEHKRRERPQVRRLAQDAQRGSRGCRRGAVVDRTDRAGRRADRGPSDEPCAEELEQREQRQHGRRADERGDALRGERAQQSAERPGGGDMPVSLLRRPRVESLAGDQPEPRREQRPRG